MPPSLYPQDWTAGTPTPPRGTVQKTCFYFLAIPTFNIDLLKQEGPYTFLTDRTKPMDGTYRQDRTLEGLNSVLTESTPYTMRHQEAGPGSPILI